VGIRIHYILKMKQTKINNKCNHYYEHCHCPDCFKHCTKRAENGRYKEMRQNKKQNHKERKTLDEKKREEEINKTRVYTSRRNQRIGQSKKEKLQEKQIKNC
jgi:hypothetical protein